MKTTEDMVREDLRKYLEVAGFSLKGAVKQVKALRLGHWDQIVDRVAKEFANK